MKSIIFFILTILLINLINSEIFFKDNFQDKNWEKRWISATTKPNFGKFKLNAGDWYGPSKKEGLQTSEDYRYYSVSQEFQKLFPETFVEKPKELVIQYSVKHQQGIDCGGAYVKIFQESDLKDQSQLKDDTPYAIMFGPDICGSTKKIHVIFSFKGKNLLWKKEPTCQSDKLTHIYTLRIYIQNKDKMYEVYVDGKEEGKGKLEDDWEFLAPKQIKDPKAVKPTDWEDNEMIDDPNDKKPDGYDKEPKTMPDPQATKPSDWKDDEDGKWEAPQIPNPNYKGEWQAKKIKNSKYKGVWSAPLIDNPDYKEDSTIAMFKNLKYIAIEIWQVKSGTIFDNFLITDSFDEAKKEMDTIKIELGKEKEMFDQMEREKAEKERVERERKESEEKLKREVEEKKKAEEDAKKKVEEEKVKVEKKEDEKIAEDAKAKVEELKKQSEKKTDNVRDEL